MDKDTIFTKRVAFGYNVDKMLAGKPERYKNIIFDKIKNHNILLEKFHIELLGELGLNIVAMYMVNLDEIYITNKEDNE